MEAVEELAATAIAIAMTAHTVYIYVVHEDEPQLWGDEERFAAAVATTTAVVPAAAAAADEATLFPLWLLKQAEEPLRRARV